MDAIQAASAVYILLIFAVGFAVVISAAATGRNKTLSTDLTGWAAFLLAVAILICAVTTLAHV